MLINSGGITTTSIDGYRQGVSLRTAKQRYIGAQPKLWAGSLSHELRQIAFDAAAGAIQDFSAVDDTTRVLTMSASVDQIVSGSTAILDAFSQLPTRRGVQVIVQTLGEYCQGSRGDPVEQFVQVNEIRHVEPFVEQGGTALLGTTSYVAFSGMASGSTVTHAEALEQSSQRQIEHIVRVFDDSDAVTPRLPKKYITPERVQFVSVLQQLSCSTDVYKFEHRRSATAGFVYDSTPFGTDSIAFGGLTRYTS